jgi:hypothetical protein
MSRMIKATDQAHHGLLPSKIALRDGYDEDMLTDVLWSIGTPMVYRKLVRERGWSPERYERWAADTLCRLFLPDPPL